MVTLCFSLGGSQVRIVFMARYNWVESTLAYAPQATMFPFLSLLFCYSCPDSPFALPRPAPTPTVSPRPLSLSKGPLCLLFN